MNYVQVLFIQYQSYLKYTLYKILAGNLDKKRPDEKYLILYVNIEAQGESRTQSLLKTYCKFIFNCTFIFTLIISILNHYNR